MSVSKFPAERAPAFIPAGTSGSYSFPEPVQPGMYLVETDTTQSISSANFYIETAEGFRVGATIRGGQGYIAIPIEADTVYVNSGTFPLPITISSRDYELLAAPSAIVEEYQPNQIAFDVVLPAGSSAFRVYWPDGTSASYSGTSASVAKPGAISYPFDVGVAAIDSNAIAGRIAAYSVEALFTAFLASGTFDPGDATSVDVWLVGGGAGTGQKGGAGGAAYVYAPAVPVSAPVSVVVGAGGSGGNGSTTSFGPLTAAGGFASTGPNGGSSPTFGGGTSAGDGGGGGGGFTAAGSNGTYSVPTGISSAGPGGAGAATVPVFGVTVAGGGGGGAFAPTNPAGLPGAGADGGGSGGDGWSFPSGGSYAGGNGAANRGGGSGGQYAYPTYTSNGGSGRVLVKKVG